MILTPHASECSDCHTTDSAARPHAVPADRKLCGYHVARVARFVRANPLRCAHGHAIPLGRSTPCGCTAGAR
jgi:hypothetical protein